MKLIVLILLSPTLLLSCASNDKSQVQIVDEVGPNCSAVADLSAIGFSVMPPVATAMAKDLLKKKAVDFHVNTVKIDSKKGIFNVDIKATGYFCRLSS